MPLMFWLMLKLNPIPIKQYIYIYILVERRLRRRARPAQRFALCGPLPKPSFAYQRIFPNHQTTHPGNTKLSFKYERVLKQFLLEIAFKNILLETKKLIFRFGGNVRIFLRFSRLFEISQHFDIFYIVRDFRYVKKKRNFRDFQKMMFCH